MSPLEITLILFVILQFLVIATLVIFIMRFVKISDEAKMTLVKAIMSKNLTELATSTSIEQPKAENPFVPPEFIPMDEALEDEELAKKVLGNKDNF